MLPDPTPNVVYHSPCYAGRKGREGVFPARACIKLTGTFGKFAGPIQLKAHAGGGVEPSR